MVQQKDVIYQPLDGGSFASEPVIASTGTPPEPTNSSLTARLQSATRELRELEELVRSGDMDPRVLTEFRGAVDYIRTTTWAVQQWVGLAQQSGDPYTILPILSAERVRRATQLAKDLSLDLQAVEVTFETPGLRELFEAIEDLYHRLAVLCKRKESH